MKVKDMLKELKRNNITPTPSSNTSILHAVCEMNGFYESWNLQIEMVDEQNIPRSNMYETNTYIRRGCHIGLLAKFYEKTELATEARVMK